MKIIFMFHTLVVLMVVLAFSTSLLPSRNRIRYWLRFPKLLQHKMQTL